jgi:PKD repeat protein
MEHNAAATGATASHTYEKLAAYTVKLTVKDSKGWKNSLRKGVDLAKPTAATPLANAVFRAAAKAPSSAARFDLTGRRLSTKNSIAAAPRASGMEVAIIPGVAPRCVIRGK